MVERALELPGRGAALDWSVRAIFLFMFVNGAVVFATGPVRVLGVVAMMRRRVGLVARRKGRGRARMKR